MKATFILYVGRTEVSRSDAITISNDGHIDMTSVVEEVHHYFDWTLEDLEKLYPNETKDRRYTKVTLDCVEIDGNGILTKLLKRDVSTWTWVKSINYDTADGYMSNYPITEIPVRFTDVTGIPFKPSTSNGPNYLYTDINHLTGLTFDYVGEITWDDNDINWGFNQFNAVIRLKDLIDKYQSVNCEGKPYVNINWMHGIGYWFGEITKETIYSETNAYYNKQTGKVEVPHEE